MGDTGISDFVTEVSLLILQNYTNGSKNLTSVLSGTTAVVASLILILVPFFGTAIIFPNRLIVGVDRFAAVMSIVAFFALYHFKGLFW